MKRKLLIILSIISLTGISFIAGYNGIFSDYNYFTANKAIKNGNIVIILRSDSDISTDLQEFNAKYGIRTRVIDLNIINFKGIEIYNKAMDNALKEKLGKITYLRYRNELDSISQTWIVFP